MAVTLWLAGCGGSSVDGLGGEPRSLVAGQTQQIANKALAKPSKQDYLTAKKSADQLAKRAKGAAYRLGSQDVIDIEVFKVGELSKTVQVSETGTFNYPLVGDVPASGKTAQEVQRVLTSRLGRKYLQDPQVIVRVKEMNSRRFTVEGAVKKPGIYPVAESTSLLQAIALGGGLTPVASSTVVVIRKEGGKRKAAKFDLDEIRSGSAADPTLRPGDLVVASKSTGQQALQHVLKVLPLLSIFTVI